MRFRRVMATLISTVALLLGATGCLPSTDPAADEVIAAIADVPGVNEADIHIGTTNGAKDYAFTIYMDPDPSAQALRAAVAAYGTGIQKLSGRIECTVKWSNDAQERQLWINSDEQRFVPASNQVGAMASWPLTLRLSASASSAAFKVSMTSTDETYAADVAALVDADLVADTFVTDSPRFGMVWQDAAPTDLFNSVTLAAPTASRISVSHVRPAAGISDEAAIEVTWPDSTDTELYAVTDIWAAQEVSTWLGLTIGDTLEVGLDNATCPSENPRGSRTAEFWTYATTDGNSVFLAPSSC